MLEVERAKPLGERVYEIIKQMIVEGELVPDEQVPESVLAKRLGVSRSPVKAALTRLQSDGLVVGEAWKVPHVAPLNAKYVRDSYQVRQALDTQCALLAINNIPNDQIAALTASLAAAGDGLANDDSDGVRAAFFLFQSLLITYCDNELLRGMQALLSDHLLRIRNAVHSDKEGEWLRHEYDRLKDIEAAIVKRDAKKVAELLSRLHDEFVDWLLSKWDI